MRHFFIFCFSIFFIHSGIAQELLFDVTVNTPKIQNVDPKVFVNMETAIEEFLNNTKWTDDVFNPEERIKAKLQLTIEEEISQTAFRANFAIQSTRPIYGSSEETPLLNHVDKDIRFEYEPFQPIIFSQNIFQDNLSQLLAFYAYLILGLDYDSFSPLGGDQYFKVAQEIVNNVPQNVTGLYQGWRQLDGNRNRYWISENVNSPRIRDFRIAMYKYHREALDNMTNDPVTSRSLLMEAISTIEKVNRNYPNSMILQMFSNSKRGELIEILKQGDKTQKDNFFRAMVKIDASNASEYSKIGR